MPEPDPVLVVEDDADIREAIRDACAAEGYAATEAADGSAALDYLRSHLPPALILLDWNMAGMNGEQFMCEIAKIPEFAGIPVVLVTADARIAKKVVGRGFVAYLEKPCDLEALFEVVGRYCLRQPT